VKWSVASRQRAELMASGCRHQVDKSLSCSKLASAFVARYTKPHLSLLNNSYQSFALLHTPSLSSTYGLLRLVRLFFTGSTRAPYVNYSGTIWGFRRARATASRDTWRWCGEI